MEQVEVPIEVGQDPEETVGPDGDASEQQDAGATEETPKEETIPSEADVWRRQAAASDKWAKHCEKMRDTHAGKLGSDLDVLRKENARLRSGGHRSVEDGDDPSEDHRRAPEAPPDPRIDQLVSREERNAEREDRASAEQAYSNALVKFDREFPNLDKAIVSDVGAFVDDRKQEISDALDTGSAERVEYVTERLLNRAYQSAISSRRKGHHDDETERQTKLIAQKRDATPPGRQAPGSGSREGRSPDINNATLEEMRAEYRRRGRKGF